MCWQSLQSSQTFPVCAWLSWVPLEVVPARIYEIFGEDGVLCQSVKATPVVSVWAWVI